MCGDTAARGRVAPDALIQRSVNSFMLVAGQNDHQMSSNVPVLPTGLSGPDMYHEVRTRLVLQNLTLPIIQFMHLFVLPIMIKSCKLYMYYTF